MSFSETVFLFVLALVVFGPKKLPEIARRAGRLLAELRRASNEFKSQIESEVAHLDVENSQKSLPPIKPPEGAVASLSLNPAASETAPPASNATLAAPVADPVLPAATTSNEGGVSEEPVKEEVASPSPLSSPAEVASATQDSHA